MPLRSTASQFQPDIVSGARYPSANWREQGQTAARPTGNDIAIEAYPAGKLPFPDGAIIAAQHWNEAASDENNKVLANGFPGAGSAVNVQFMVKDSKKYAATGGWGFADFTNGQPGSEALHKTCFACHEPAKDRDYVFTRRAPTP
jgi:Cytochrome P460